MVIDSPQELVGCLCGTTGQVCVKGKEAVRGSQIAAKVYGKIYIPPEAPANPGNGPPAGAVSTVPNAVGKWCLGLVSGADCAASPGPYPANRIWCWAEFIDVNNVKTYDYIEQEFTGRCDASLPTCCSSSSST